jgi:hypothetical protein
MNKNEEPKNAFLTDIDLNIRPVDRAPPKPTNPPPVELKDSKNNIKLPSIRQASKPFKKKPKKPLREEEPVFFELEHYVNTLGNNAREEPVAVKPKTHDKIYSKFEANVANFQSNNVTNFLRQHKKIIEETIYDKYAKQTDPELEEFIKQIERTNSFQSLLATRENELLRMKKVYNAKMLENKNLTSKIESLANKIAKLEIKKMAINPLQDANANTKEVADSASMPFLELVNHDKEVLDNVKNNCKDDILTILKNNQQLKAASSKTNDTLNHLRAMLQRENDLLSASTMRLLDIKKGKSKRRPNEVINENIKNQFSNYEDQIKLHQILANEEKIQKSLEVKEHEEREKERARHQALVEKQRREELAELAQINNELQDAHEKIALLMRVVEVNDQSELYFKVTELKSSKKILLNLRNNYMNEIRDLNEEVAELKRQCELVLISDITNPRKPEVTNEVPLETSQVTDNHRVINSKFEQIEIIRKEKNQSLYNHMLECQKYENVFLNCASTISRILFQLNASAYKNINITPINILDYFTQIGLQFEKLVNQIQADEEDSGDEGNGIQMLSETELESYQRPPTWLRLNKHQDTIEFGKDNKPLISNNI